MIKTQPILLLFYNTTELTIQDIDSELFTADRHPFHFFMFHNREMHFSKNIIFKQTLVDYFHNVEPEFEMNENELIMIKKLHDFNMNNFDALIERKYEEYLGRIGYRIDCIFQTFTIFSKLYNDKPQIYVVPEQIQEQFHKLVKKESLHLEELTIINPLLKNFDIFYWLNYYSRKEVDHLSDGVVKQENVTRILQYHLATPKKS